MCGSGVSGAIVYGQPLAGPRSNRTSAAGGLLAFALAIAERSEPMPESAVVVTEMNGRLLIVDSNAPRSGAVPTWRSRPARSVGGSPPMTFVVPLLMTYDAGDSMGRNEASSLGSAVVVLTLSLVPGHECVWITLSYSFVSMPMFTAKSLPALL